jgi:hypothetical protein
MHDDDRAFGAAMVAGVATNQLWIGISSGGTRVRVLCGAVGHGHARAGRECGRRSELALSGWCSRGGDGEAIERDHRQLDACNHSNGMLGGQRDAHRELSAADELPGNAHGAIRLVVRIVRFGAIRLDVRWRAFSLIRIRERHDDHHVELREREEREREPEPVWSFTNRKADGRHER